MLLGHGLDKRVPKGRAVHFAGSFQVGFCRLRCGGAAICLSRQWLRGATWLDTDIAGELCILPESEGLLGDRCRIQLGGQYRLRATMETT